MCPILRCKQSHVRKTALTASKAAVHDNGRKQCESQLYGMSDLFLLSLTADARGLLAATHSQWFVQDVAGIFLRMLDMVRHPGMAMSCARSSATQRGAT